MQFRTKSGYTLNKNPKVKCPLKISTITKMENWRQI